MGYYASHYGDEFFLDAKLKDQALARLRQLPYEIEASPYNVMLSWPTEALRNREPGRYPEHPSYVAVTEMIDGRGEMEGQQFEVTRIHGVWWAPDVDAAETLEDALAATGWDTFTDESGDITELRWAEGKWVSHAELPLQALGGLARPGSWTAVSGEDGLIWRYFFRRDGHVIEQVGEVVFGSTED